MSGSTLQTGNTKLVCYLMLEWLVEYPISAGSYDNKGAVNNICSNSKENLNMNLLFAVFLPAGLEHCFEVITSVKRLQMNTHLQNCVSFNVNVKLNAF